eukprot:1139974-Pelagomonas_calceolata.AAC.7
MFDAQAENDKKGVKGMPGFRPEISAARHTQTCQEINGSCTAEAASILQSESSEFPLFKSVCAPEHQELYQNS